MEKTKTEPKHPALQGLYAITQASDSLADQVEQAIRGGAKIIQYRDKSTDRARRIQEAQALLEICHRYDTPLIINDDVELAQQLGADGVHLGGDDAGYEHARTQLGPRAIIGISCYNQLSLALQAQAWGADYVAFGRFFPSRSKPAAVQANVLLLRQAREQLRIPIVAIGGITPNNGRQLIEAGASMLAVIDAVFGQPDVTLAAQAFQGCFLPELIFT